MSLIPVTLRGIRKRLKGFFGEIVEGLGGNPKILICLFAVPREDWETKFATDTEIYKTFFEKDVVPTFELALPETFAEQVKKSNVTYIHGGDDHLIMYWLKKFNLSELWEGKVVATNSASSHALSKYFWTCAWRKCMEGLGILPIKFIAHYKSDYGASDPRGPIDWDRAYQELSDCNDKNLPIYALEEGDFCIIR